MEGTLLKWTNYYNGWQPRYFILSETGVLSYYKSKELINEGCKGSCLILACEVKAHPHDSFRFDLIIPGEQFFCLKAKSQPERQHWLVALGSCKSRGTKSSSTNNNNNNDQSKENTDASSMINRLSVIDQEIKLKVQELRLYETVLMQRVHSVKSIVTETPTPDVQKLDETTSMLSVTCDAFIHTLDECIQLATGGSTPSLLLLSATSSNNGEQLTTQRKSSNDFDNLPKQIVYRTFFSELQQTFSTLSCLSFEEIQSELFLSTCEQYLTLIDKLNSTAFVSYRSDTNANIDILRKKLENNPTKYFRLCSIIEDEISSQSTQEKYSATNALISLKRNLEFICYFLQEFSRGDKTVEEALNKSYGQTLKHFHQWNTRQIYSIDLKSVITNEELFHLLAIDLSDTNEVLFERQIFNEMNQHANQMKIVLKKINQFYQQNKLQSNEFIG